jgi:hypothetical protein
MQKFIKVKSRDGEIKRIASTCGRVYLVGKDFVDIPIELEQLAFISGCVSENVINDIIKSQQVEQNEEDPPDVDLTQTKLPTDRVSIISEKIMFMIRRGAKEDFTVSGIPNKKTLAGLCGFAPTKEEFDFAWGNIVEEAESSK